MIALIYARVSTEEQVKGYSLDSQIVECKKKAKELGATKIIEYVDKGISGVILERPGLSAARERVRAGGISLFICYDPDRLARTLSHQLLLTEEIEKKGVKLEFVNFEWKNTPEGKLFYSLRGAIAEYEKEKIRERTQRGKLTKARQGKLTHNPQIYGYNYDKKTDGLIINTEHAEIVKLIYRWFIQEKETGLHTIATRLSEMQIPSPKGKKTWYKQTVKRILMNETYTGKLHLQTVDTSGVKNNKYKNDEDKARRKMKPREEWIEIKVPQIIDDTTFQKAQTKMQKIRRMRPGRAKHNFLLSGLCICGLCGSTMHGNKVYKYVYYTCTAKSPGIKGKAKCNLPSVNAVDIENKIWEQVIKWISNPVNFSEELKKQYGCEDVQGYSKQLEFIENNITSLKKQKEKILDLYQRDLLSLEEIEVKLNDFKQRIEKLIEKKNKILDEIEAVKKHQVNPDELEKLFANLKGKIKELSFDNKKYLIDYLIEEILIFENEINVKVKVPKEYVNF